MKKSEIIFGVIKVPVDFIMIALAFVSAYFLRQSSDFVPYYNQSADLASFPDTMTYIHTVSFFGIALIILLTLYRSYSFKLYNTFSKEGKTVLQAWLTWVGLILLYYFVIRDFPFSRLVIMFGWILSFAYLLVGRALVKGLQKLLLRYKIGKRNLIIVGYSRLTKKILPEFIDDNLYNVIGLVGKRKVSSKELKKNKIKYLGNTEDLPKLIKKHKVDEVIQVSGNATDERNQEVISICREMHVLYQFVPNQLMRHRSKIGIQIVNGYPLISLKTTPLDGWSRVVKRIFDVMFSFAALTLLSPFMLLTALIIKLDSRGPVFFTRLDDGSPVVRVGEKGSLFRFYKFRSMQDKSHSLRYTQLAAKNKRSGPMVKIKDDPRITRVGKFIRKFDIDEWPNFYSVLIGDMSVVGPRPHLPEEVDKYERHHKFVLSIKPGITGLAQVSGRSNLSFEEEVQLDTFYIENWSLWLDLKIIIQTIWVVIRGKGE